MQRLSDFAVSEQWRGFGLVEMPLERQRQGRIFATPPKPFVKLG